MRESRNRREPLIPTKLPLYPWQKVETDLFQIGKQHYLIVVDYYSRFPEVIKLSTTTSQAVISALKPIFARYGIPETFYSENGPQYQSGEFKQFAKEYDFNRVTSSPHFPQSNGLAERTVQTVKKLLQDSDPCLALFNFRATPLPWCRLCPSQLLMGRPLRSNLPSVQENLVPDWSHLRQFAQMDREYKLKQKQDFDKRHRTSQLPIIPDDTPVYVETEGQRASGVIVGQDASPRLYWVDTSNQVVRRNRRHLVPRPDCSDGLDSPVGNLSPTPSPAPSRIMTRSQTGTSIRPPDWYDPSPPNLSRKGDVV